MLQSPWSARSATLGSDSLCSLDSKELFARRLDRGGLRRSGSQSHLRRAKQCAFVRTRRNGGRHVNAAPSGFGLWNGQQRGIVQASTIGGWRFVDHRGRVQRFGGSRLGGSPAAHLIRS